MSHPIDVGSVLGGRYKVTATVLTSHDQDLVLDGVDQVLNRAVSILVAGPDNADQVAQSAREVATGERPGNVQILDLGVSEATTYLITNHTSAADLLDLVVSSNPPYVEPFFTDTLGSEIFGQPRSHEPETYDGLYDEEEVDAGYINYGQSQPARAGTGAAPAVSAGVSGRAYLRVRDVSAAAAAAAAGAAGAAAAAVPRSRSPAPSANQAPSPETARQRPPPTRRRPSRCRESTPLPAATVGSTAAGYPPETPKVSLWSDDDYDQPAPDDRQTARPAARRCRRPPWPACARRTARRDTSPARPGAPTPRRMTSTTARTTSPGASRAPCAGWWAGCWLPSWWSAWFLPSPISAASSRPLRSPNAGGITRHQRARCDSRRSRPSTASAAPAAGPPAIEGVTRLGNFDFAGTYDGDLVKTFDGNAASYWSDMEFATDNWGGLAPEGVRSSSS